eukprot:GHVP01002972.1.p1 GENE.GHVP01002972.1~~GHVP01002972.1.p1  ORF type:complete len:487 (+),score=72.24 GHVP01002972.1:763-2223(+)
MKTAEAHTIIPQSPVQKRSAMELDSSPEDDTLLMPDDTRMVMYLIGLSEGLTHLAHLAMYYLFKDDLKLSPAQMSTVLVLPSIPWVFKPMLGFISDSVPIFGMRRKPYLIILSMAQSLSFIGLAFANNSIVLCAVAILGVSFSGAFCSAIAEGFVVENCKQFDEGAVETVSQFTFAKAIGSLVVAYMSGYLVEAWSKFHVFVLTSFFPLLITFAALSIKENDTVATPDPMLALTRLVGFLKQRIILGPALFVLLYMVGPDYDDALFFYYTNVLNFPPSFMGSLRLTYGIAAIVSIMFYRIYLSKFSYRRMLIVCIFLAFPIYISPVLLVSRQNLALGISDKVFVLSGGFLTEAVAEIELLPLLVLVTRICPAGLEASVYSAMVSIRFLGGGISKSLSSVAISLFGITSTNFKHLAAFILFCGFFSILPLCFIWLIPTESEIRARREAGELTTEGQPQEDHHVPSSGPDIVAPFFRGRAAGLPPVLN